jgi:uncharacterized protein (DUF2267 family)
MRHDEFMTKVGQRADISLEAADAVTSATLRTLAERVSGGAASELATPLPEELRTHLADADEPAEPFGADEFVRRVADRAATDADRATAGIRAVFVTLRETVPSGTLDNVETQLPKEYAGLVGAKG